MLNVNEIHIHLKSAFIWFSIWYVVVIVICSIKQRVLPSLSNYSVHLFLFTNWVNGYVLHVEKRRGVSEWQFCHACWELQWKQFIRMSLIFLEERKQPLPLILFYWMRPPQACSYTLSQLYDQDVVTDVEEQTTLKFKPNPETEIQKQNQTNNKQHIEAQVASNINYEIKQISTSTSHSISSVVPKLISSVVPKLISDSFKMPWRFDLYL